MEFLRQKYWNGLPFPSPGDLSDPGIETTTPELAGEFFFFLPLSHLGSPEDFILSYYVSESTCEYSLLREGLGPKFCLYHHQHNFLYCQK